MNKFKRGDKVNIHDGSYCFGVQNGEYSQYCNNFDDSRKKLTVVKVDLSVMVFKNYSIFGPSKTSGEFSAVNDLLVTDNHGSYWFTQSRFCRPVEPVHTIVIDSRTIELSHKSFLALREQLV